LEIAANLVVAGLIGLAVGIEREWSGHASGPGARFAGVRTFFLVGLIGGLGGLFAARGEVAIATPIVAGTTLLAVTAYAVAASRGGAAAADGTTEVAAIAVLALGLMAGFGELRLAAAVGAGIVLALREKSVIHHFVTRLEAVELRAGLQFAALALVVLPILPSGPFGPLGGIRPRELWTVVLIVSGLNFAGYIARRTAGPSRGMVITGMLGGLISSTAVALTFSRQSRDSGAASGQLAVGVIGACTILLPRLALLTLIFCPPLTLALLPFFLPPLAVGALLVWQGLSAAPGEASTAVSTEGRSPLRLGSAILLALGFQAVLMAMTVVRARFGNPGVLASSALLGFTDMDALTLSMIRLATEDAVELAATAMAIGVLSNTVLKLSVVLAMGAGPFRRRAAVGLLALGVASVAGLMIGV
jgi:uncharacterized membrane protein (DUF4010 family)